MATDYSKTIWDFFLPLIGNEYGTAALMGNLEAESGLRPNNLQNSYESSLGYTDTSYTAAVDSGAYSRGSFVNDEAGYGLAQWTYSSRKAALYDFWKATGISSIGDISVQCGYLYLELRNDYSGVWTTLCNASNIRDASDAVLHDFENPADQSTSVEEKRAAMGVKWYNLYSGGYVPNPTPNKRKGMPLLLMYQATRRRY